MGEYKPVSPIHLEIDPMTIETYISVFEALKLDETSTEMTIVYDASRAVWTVVLVGFETDGLLEFLASVHMELPVEVEKPEDVWSGTADGPVEAPKAHVEHAVVFTEAEVPQDDREEEDPGYLEDAEAEQDEEITQSTVSTSSGKVVVLKKPRAVQKSGAISVEED